ncbi:alpha/beta hydrolase [Amycolatopsis sp. NPDC004625]|uniref:alpha/beta hydrolase n=1 Tax=Amycolatopsis sp. NPDC004625 TaxID=3154670 RepID=UPI0033BA83E1
MARVLRVLLVLVVAVVVLSGGYLGYAAIRASRPVTLPAPAGPYAVGRTITEWTDRTRADPLAPHPGTPRRLSVWMWYPTTVSADANPAPYAPGLWAGLQLGAPLGWGETSLADVRTHSTADAPVAAGRFPVLVLEPGLGFSAPQYTAFAESLAGRGYLVLGVTPTYSANLSVLDGAAVAATEAGNPPAFEAADLHQGAAQTAGDRLVDVWAADARFAAAQAAAKPFADPASTVYIGHSFGGAAALEACRTDPHCAGAADLDGTQYGTVVHTGLTRPALLIGSENSCITGVCRPATPADQADQTTARTMLAASRGPAWRFRVRGAEHFDFSDYNAYYLATPIRSVLPLGDITGAETLVNAYLGAFADHVTRGKPEPLLTGPSPFPEVEGQPPAP